MLVVGNPRRSSLLAGDLSPLAVVEVVWGSLEFRGTNLTNTVGLHNVVNVLNNLQFLDNLLLTESAFRLFSFCFAGVGIGVDGVMDGWCRRFFEVIVVGYEGLG